MNFSTTEFVDSSNLQILIDEKHLVPHLDPQQFAVGVYGHKYLLRTCGKRTGEQMNRPPASAADAK
jgi:hypothetical protein